MRLNTVRARLVLLFFAITTAAVGFVYLYVVPQLRSSLTAEKLSRLEQVGADESRRLAVAMRRGVSQTEIRRLARMSAQRADARVTIVALRQGPSGPEPAFVVADSEVERTAVAPLYPAAAAAAVSGRAASTVERVDGERIGETAIDLSRGRQAQWVAVLSTPLAEVDDNVALISRQILIAGSIAIVAALGAGSLAARAHSRRLRRLEDAAEKIAEGDFSTPIPVDSTDEVGQLAITFNEMQKRLARLDSARSEFIANASHELRTPIFSLGGFIELLDEENPDPEARAEFVGTMREQIRRLTKLTADLLDLSKLDSDAIEIAPDRVGLGELAERVAAEFGPAADQHGSRIRADVGDPVTAVADPERLAQIMRILIDNALTHTPPGTRITLTAELHQETAELTVADDGPGIEAHDRERVFERFYTGDELGGSGLGLAIARELAIRMGGDIGVNSRRGRTRFTLRLPAASARGAARA